MAAKPSVEALIQAYARKLGLDPRAVAAVAQGEGGLKWGAVGDGGHAFGPFQMNDAGGVLTNRFGTSQARASFANSPAGVMEAMRAMARSAKGLKGQAAVRSIITNYERPADIPGSINRALGRLGSVQLKGGSGTMALSPSSPGSATFQAESPGDDHRKALLDWSMAGVQSFLNGEAAPDIMQFMGEQATSGTDAPLSLSPARTAPRSNIPSGTSYGGPGGAKGVIAAIKRAQSMGLRVSENPWVDKVDPVHVQGSDHYKTYAGGKVGHAEDVSGDPSKITAYFKWMEKNAKRLGLKDAFYTPMGYSYDEGKRTSYLQPKHDDHGHFSFF